LQKIIDEWADAGFRAMTEAIDSERFAPPPNWIPVYLSLQGVRIKEGAQLSAELINAVHRLACLWDSERPSEPERLFDNPDLHWLICLDGLDEIWDFEGQKHFMEALKPLLRRYSMKVILTTRPDITGYEGLGKVVEVALFDASQITTYIANYVGGRSREGYRQVVEFLSSNEELWALCSVPLYLEAALPELVGEYSGSQKLSSSDVIQNEQLASTYTQLQDLSIPMPRIDVNLLMLPPASDEVEPPQNTLDNQKGIKASEEPYEPYPERPINLGQLLHRIYPAVRDRESIRHPYQPHTLRRWWRATGEVAICLAKGEDFESNQAEEYFKPEEGINWILSLGIMQPTDNDGWLQYATKLTNEYFAAAFLLPFVEKGDSKEARKYWRQCRDKPTFQQGVYKMLDELVLHSVDLTNLTGGKLWTGIVKALQRIYPRRT